MSRDDTIERAQPAGDPRLEAATAALRARDAAPLAAGRRAELWAGIESRLGGDVRPLRAPRGRAFGLVAGGALAAAAPEAGRAPVEGGGGRAEPGGGWGELAAGGWGRRDAATAAPAAPPTGPIAVAPTPMPAPPAAPDARALVAEATRLAASGDVEA